MATETDLVLKILEERKQISEQELSAIVRRSGVLGFGVRPIDIVYHLQREGLARYDRKNGIVYLVEKKE